MHVGLRISVNIWTSADNPHPSYDFPNHLFRTKYLPLLPKKSIKPQKLTAYTIHAISIFFLPYLLYLSSIMSLSRVLTEFYATDVGQHTTTVIQISDNTDLLLLGGSGCAYYNMQAVSWAL